MSQQHTVVLRAPGYVPTRQVRANRVTLHAFHQLTRAHVVINENPPVIEAITSGASRVAQALTEQLKVECSIDGRLHDTTASPISHLSRTAVFVVLELSAAGGLAVIELEPQLVNTLLTRIAGSAERSAGPFHLTRIEQAALGWLSLTAIHAARDVSLIDLSFGPRLLAVTDDRSAVLNMLDCRTRLLNLELTVALGSVRHKARLLLPQLAVQTAVQKIAPIDAPANEPVVPRAGRLQLRVFVGHAALTPADVRSLAEGDVILFGDVAFDGLSVCGATKLRAPHFAFFGQLSAEGFTCEGSTPTPQSLKESPMSNHALPVDVEVELTRIRLTLAEIANLKKGAVLPLLTNGAQPVTLCVGDQPIARAELVEVEGELGARIIELIEGAS